MTIVQPGSGVGPVLTAIRKASKSIDIMIFRLDIQEMRKALAAAVARGVNVRALIAHTNRGGEKTLRKLEQALLDAGVTVSRTGDDFVRYHGKMMIVDAKALHVYGFNFTWLDIERSRGFGLVIKHKRLVQEAMKVFEADSARQPYAGSYDRFVVSPENARDRLTALIKGARKQLLIYDPKISDPALLRLLKERAKAGVEVRVIGKVAGAPRPASWPKNIPASDSTSARSCRTVTSCSSAARACAGWSWTSAARSASSWTTRRRCSR